MDIARIADLANGLTALALSLVGIYAFVQGVVVPATVVESIIQKTVAAVLENTRKDYEEMLSKLTAEMTSRTITAIDAMLKEHKADMQRGFDDVSECVKREIDRSNHGHKNVS